MMSISAIIVNIAGGICCIEATALVVQHYRLIHSKGMKSFFNDLSSLSLAKLCLFVSSRDLRHSVNLLKDQTNVLSDTLDFRE